MPRHCAEAKPTKQSSGRSERTGLLRFARNDDAAAAAGVSGTINCRWYDANFLRRDRIIVIRSRPGLASLKQAKGLRNRDGRDKPGHDNRNPIERVCRADFQKSEPRRS
jgi:hypothetical protein